MKVNDLNKQPTPRANLSRTGFDMSQEFAFTASTGMILPVYQDFYNAGETAYYSGDLICRTQPLVTAAMADVDLFLDWFFVPMQMLFTLFGSKRWMTNDLISSFYSSAISNDDLPIFNIESYLTHGNDYNDSSDSLYNVGYDDSFECLGKSQFRLANHLGFNPYGIFSNNSQAETTLSHQSNPNVFPMFALAYQAIYQDYFRLPLDDFIKRDVKAFNVDTAYQNTSTPVTASPSVAALFCLHYRSRAFDYFTSSKASPISSSVNLLGSSSASSPSSILSKVNDYLNEVNRPNPSSPYLGGVQPATGTTADNFTQERILTVHNSNVYAVGSNQLRSLFAVEKLQRILGRSKKDYDSQVLAHFGFEVPHDVKHELTHLKEQHAVIHIGEVISTADTYDGNSGSALGSIGGKGYGIVHSKKPFKFTAPCDGILMCTFSSSVRMRYNRTFDKQNAVHTRLDFYQPEFDHLGMQPLYGYEAIGYTDDSTRNSERLAWQYRYSQWKRKYNRTTEAFASNVVYNQINQNAAWVVSRSPFGIEQSSSDSVSRYCLPTDLNGIMVVPYTTGWSASYLTNPQTMFYTDPFICAFRANVKKVSTMSTYGEPNLNAL